LWKRAIKLEKQFGTTNTLQIILNKAIKSCPKCEEFWLMLAKEKLKNENLKDTKIILDLALQENSDSEELYLAAVKIELKSNEIEKGRLLLEKGRKLVNSPRMWIKSIIFERDILNFKQQKIILEEALKNFPKEEKLWLINAQFQLLSNLSINNNNNLNNKEINNLNNNINNNTTNINKDDIYFTALNNSFNIYQKGLSFCSNCISLWKGLINIQEILLYQNFILPSPYIRNFLINNNNNNINNNKIESKIVMIRALLEKSRLINPKNGELWLLSTRVESRINYFLNLLKNKQNNNNSNFSNESANSILWKDYKKFQKVVFYGQNQLI
jgi:hypothetical protein